MKGIKFEKDNIRIVLLHHIDEEGREVTGVCSDLPGMKCYTKEDKDGIMFKALEEAFTKIGFKKVEEVEE